MESLFSCLRPGASVYFVGIKGTGVCALAELLYNMGIKVSGSDSADVFYTDAILKELNIPYYESFDPVHIKNDYSLVIHSAAYSAENNSELAEAVRKDIPVLSYPNALGEYSAAFDSTGIAGVHGKTTTAAMCGCLMKSLEIPAQILVGSAVANYGGKSTLILGSKYFIAETCEYRKHFLAFRPQRIIITAVESDHQDFFQDYNSIRDAFVEYGRKLLPGSELIYCADDPGAAEVAGIIDKEDRGVALIPYGFTVNEDFGIGSYRMEKNRAFFNINVFKKELSLRIPGRHQALNAAASIALASVMLKKELDESGLNECWNEQRQNAVAAALDNFAGSKRRSEIIGSAAGIIFMDDYGHHPTAIRTMLEGLRNFYPSRRLVVSFMSHTYTRTAALLDNFAESLAGADVLFLHRIYASAREIFKGSINGRSIYEKIENLSQKKPVLYYTDEPMDAFEPLLNILKSGDLFLTLGAGSNWPLGVELYRHYRELYGAEL